MPMLKWGNQRLVRYMKVGPDGKGKRSDRSSLSKSPNEAVRDQEDSTGERKGSRVAGAQKLKIHLRSPPLPPLMPLSRPPPPPAEAAVADLEGERTEKKLKKIHLRSPPLPPPTPLSRPPHLPAAAAAPVQYRSLRLRGIAAAAVADLEGERAEKKRESRSDEGSYFRLALSRAEIEADFLFLTGSKPHKRPKKRSRCVQRVLDSFFPGMHIPAKITADMYKIHEPH
ncbi:hypothetical protein QJS04_geneDACA000791 [Acorus gramineus]|uniref:Uncharacterized protein n=1 Tax=Acorus gramineus TaxID=55184 RepID=A0AAV9BJV5_ACOGR|nr:hypothetical protein QJS04_geneDACA000791 [Acorus gramineus]